MLLNLKVKLEWLSKNPPKLIQILVDHQYLKNKRHNDYEQIFIWHPISNVVDSISHFYTESELDIWHHILAAYVYIG